MQPWKLDFDIHVIRRWIWSALLPCCSSLVYANTKSCRFLLYFVVTSLRIKLNQSFDLLRSCFCLFLYISICHSNNKHLWVQSWFLIFQDILINTKCSLGKVKLKETRKKLCPTTSLYTFRFSTKTVNIYWILNMVYFTYTIFLC